MMRSTTIGPSTMHGMVHIVEVVRSDMCVASTRCSWCCATWLLSSLVTINTSFAAPGLAGDYNGNGAVDAADYVMWRNTLGTYVTLANDISPGSVTQADYDFWRARFGSTAGSGSGSSVDALHGATAPEPSSLILAMYGAAGYLIAVSRRRRKYRSNLPINGLHTVDIGACRPNWIP